MFRKDNTGSIVFLKKRGRNVLLVCSQAEMPVLHLGRGGARGHRLPPNKKIFKEGEFWEC